MNLAVFPNLRRFTPILALALIIAACTPPPQASVSDVEIVGGNRSIGIGIVEQLTAVVTATGGASEEVTWATSNDAVVTVSDDGLITGITEGTAEITATSTVDTSISDTIAVTVNVADAVTSVEIEGGNRALDVGDEVDLVVNVTVTGAVSEAVTWATTNGAAVTVSSTGRITAVSAGSAEISATSVANPSVFGVITVTVTNPELPAPNLDEVFVDAAAAAGGNGHVDFPFDTIAEGIAAVNPGGIVRVRAGSYAESLHITKSLNLLGAGVGQVTIVANDNAEPAGSVSAINIQTVDGLTLSGFRLEVQAPGPELSAIGMTYTPGSANVLIENVEIFHTNATRTSRGVTIINSDLVTLRNVDIEANTALGLHEGAGVVVSGASTGIVLENVATTGHEGFSGIVLIPGTNETIANVTIDNATVFNEIAKLTIQLRNAGSAVTNLDADQFGWAVGNSVLTPNEFFYKTDLERALLDALFNFNGEDGSGDPSWYDSTVQVLDPLDQSVRLNEFIVGSVLDDAPDGYGYGIVRSGFIQAAVDAAAPDALITVQDGRYEGAAEGVGYLTRTGEVVVDVAGVTIQGAGAASIVTAGVGGTNPVFTIDADGVTLTGLQIEGDVGATGILVGTGDVLTVTASNLLSGIALDNTANAAVDASNTYWGAADGPSNAGPGTGGELIDPGALDVDLMPIAATPFP